MEGYRHWFLDWSRLDKSKPCRCSLQGRRAASHARFPGLSGSATRATHAVMQVSWGISGRECCTYQVVRLGGREECCRLLKQWTTYLRRPEFE